jgi:lipopolysaccharide/colanic/teichoic acid biosynthesis glycosyltransferase
MLVLFSPVYAGVAIWILVDDGRPVLLRQDRVGKHGRRFRMLKFRTMVPNAIEVGRKLKLSDDPYAIVPNDPRITHPGRFLRRSGLDELPQLWNVLRGEMSVVGPRPPLPREVVGYDIWHRRRLSMKPGITGLWQVAARRDPDFDRWVRLDLDYIDHWSLWLDVKIVARTIPAVLAGEGR